MLHFMLIMMSGWEFIRLLPLPLYMSDFFSERKEIRIGLKATNLLNVTTHLLTNSDLSEL